MECRIGTVPSAVAPGQTQSQRALVVVDPALPRSVLCLLGIAGNDHMLSASVGSTINELMNVAQHHE